MSERIPPADTIRNLDQSASTGDKAISIKQVRNRSGVFVYQISPLQQLRRFITLGSASNNYYVGRVDLTRANAQEVEKMIQEDGLTVVKTLVEFSTGGRVAKENNILFCLAMAARLGNDEVRKAAYEAIGPICRTFSALSMFVKFYKEVLPNTGGWGRGMRTALDKWYKDRDERSLAYQITKYPQRNGVSHRDLLLLGHVKPESDNRNLVFKYAVKGFEDVSTDPVLSKLVATTEAGVLIEAVNKLKGMRNAKEAAAHIEKFGLVHEHVPTEIKNDPAIWEALLQNMPVHAIVRNLGLMSSYGLLSANSASAKKVIEELSNLEQVKRARIHPFNVLTALCVYRQGAGTRTTWNVNTQISNALSDLFYNSFAAVEPTGARMGLFVDVSPSMEGNMVWQGARDERNQMVGSAITARQAAAAMAMATARTEKLHVMNAFAGGSGRAPGLTPIDINPGSRLEDVLKFAAKYEQGGWCHTDIALPFQWAIQTKTPIDCFVIYTDNETNQNTEQPIVALNRYRETMGIEAKLVVVAFSADRFTAGDPEDAGCMDMPGFDSGAPKAISEFAAGRI